MDKTKKIVIGVSALILTLVVILILNTLPIIFTIFAYNTQKPYSQGELNYLKKAVTCSIFKWQKNYTYENIINEFLLLEDYDEVISYYEKMEKSNMTISKATKWQVTTTYMKKGNYDTALKLAKETNDLYQQARIYIDTNDLDNAKRTVEMIFSTKTRSKLPYLYVAQIQLKEGYPTSANESINRLLEVNPQHLEALQTKAEILKKLGKTDEYNEYLQKINNRKKEIEALKN